MDTYVQAVMRTSLPVIESDNIDMVDVAIGEGEFGREG